MGSPVRRLSPLVVFRFRGSHFNHIHLCDLLGRKTVEAQSIKKSSWAWYCTHLSSRSPDNDVPVMFAVWKTFFTGWRI